MYAKNIAVTVALLMMVYVAAPARAQTMRGGEQARDQQPGRYVATSVEDALAQTSDNPLESLDAEAGQRLRRVVKILRTSDKAQVNQYVPVAFEFRNVNPHAVIRFLRRVVDVEEGNWHTFVAPDGESGVYLANVPLWQVESLTELVNLLDRPGLTTSSGSKKVYIRLKHRDPGDPGFMGVIRVLMTGDTKVLSDRPTGAIFVSDAPSGYQGVVNFIDRVDVATPQVLVRAKVYEIDLTNDGTIGLDFHAWKNGPGRNLFAFGAFSEGFRTNPLSTNGVDGVGNPIISPGANVFGLPGHRLSNSGRNYAYFYDVPSAFFDFLVTKGRARVLTAPRAAVMHGETAHFSLMDEILFYRVQSGPSALAGVRPDGLPLDPFGDNVNFPDNRTLSGDLIPRIVPDVAEVGIEFDVTPQVGSKSINLDVDVTIVSQLGFDDSGIPMLSSRDVGSEFRVFPNQEYIIGGLTWTRSIQTTRKIPFLGSIPVLGWLFGSEITTQKKTMVVMALETQVVEDFSGMGIEELSVVDAVKDGAMASVALPPTLVGFDMMLMEEGAGEH